MDEPCAGNLGKNCISCW